VLTVGIDLAAQDKDTAACQIEWSQGAASVSVPDVGLSDDALVDRVTSGDRVGIDAPFGWPDEFVAAVLGYANTGRFPLTERKRLRYRETDRYVEQHARLPLSVSSDRIAVTAMRCASLLTRLAEEGMEVDRSGGGKLVEVYPAAALARWDIDPRGYKTGDKARAARGRVLDRLEDFADGWLKLSPPVREACVESDDALDAFVAALVAHAAELGMTEPAPRGLEAQAQREGWIHLPRTASLSVLGR
jgi:predicted nuclease with RNAse H fold